ncbi:hypothetical protein DFH28DRAFT_1137573 [Melampsora americana]|nr:hypothetical protein DFH28DRAFT_1137573 [Melampsora americana]
MDEIRMIVEKQGISTTDELGTIFFDFVPNLTDNVPHLVAIGSTLTGHFIKHPSKGINYLIKLRHLDSSTGGDENRMEVKFCTITLNTELSPTLAAVPSRAPRVSSIEIPEKMKVEFNCEEPKWRQGAIVTMRASIQLSQPSALINWTLLRWARPPLHFLDRYRSRARMNSSNMLS